MKEVEYKDNRGRLFRVMIPEDAPQSNAKYGIILGPPVLDKMNLPERLQIALHNELYNRRILTRKDAIRRADEIVSAIKTVIKADVGQVIACYENP